MQVAALLFFAFCGTACGAVRTSAPSADLGEPVARAMPAAGPVLHGGAVAWGETSFDEADERVSIQVMEASPGAATRLLYGLHPTQGQPEWSFGDFAASPEGIALVRTWMDCEPAPYDQCVDRTDVAVGARDAAFQLLPRHDQGCNYVPASHHLDLDGNRVVFSGAFCAPGCGPCTQIAIDDVTDSAPPRVLVSNPGAVDDVRVAGNFVVARSVSWERLSMFDLRTGKLVYKMRLPANPRIDLQPDGKLVAAWWGRERTTAAWFSPDEPWKHVIPVEPVWMHPYEEHAAQITVRIANDRVAFERQISPEKSELVVADLSGKVVQHVASFDKKRARVADFDFDGKRMTWATQEVHDVTKKCWRISEAGHMACREHYSGPTTIYVARLS